MSTEIHGFGEQVDTYPGMFWTYGAIDAAMDDVNAHYVILKSDVARSTVELRSTPDGLAFIAQWIPAYNNWSQWYRANRFGIRGTFQAAVGGLQDQIRLSAARFNAFESRASTLGVNITPVGNPTGWEVPTVAWVGLGVVSLGFAAWLAHSASRFAPAANVAAERFRTGSTSFPAMAGLRGKRARRHR
jgi:hypothetical protein